MAIVNAVNLVNFADKATLAARKEMIGLFLSVYHAEEKKVSLEYDSISSIASTKSEVLTDKVLLCSKILLHDNIDKSNTSSSYLDGTNTMSGERTGLQRRILNVSSFSIYINCRCHCLALCFKHLFDQFPWLESIGRLLLGLWRGFDYLRKNCHILKSIQNAYGLKVLNLVKAAVTRWLSHGAACKCC